MFVSSRLSASLIGCGSVILMTQLPSVALSARQVSALAKQTTVRIFSQTPGSGVIIKREGDTYTVLTCAHVIQTEDDYEITTSDNQSHPVNNQTIRRLENVDLAVVKFNSPKSYKVLPLGNSDGLNVGAPSYASGFPLNSIHSLESTYRFSPGHISAKAQKSLKGGYAMVYPNETFRGMSGGPVLGANGKLIGIHGQSITKNIETGGISQESGLKLGFSLAIPVRTFYDTSNQLQMVLDPLPPQPTPKPASVTADDLYLRAVEQFMYKNDPQGAIASTTEAIKLNPGYGDAFRLRGYARLSALPKQQETHMSSVIQQVLKDFDQAIQYNGNDADALIIRGFLRLGFNQPNVAIQDFNQVIQLRPTLQTAYFYRGKAYSDMDQPEKALQDYSEAIRLYPEYAQAYNNRGITLAKQEKLREALQDFTQVIRLRPNDDKAYYHRAQVRDALGDAKGAIADYDKALELKGKSP